MIVPSSRSAHAHGRHYETRRNTPRRRRSASVKKDLVRRLHGPPAAARKYLRGSGISTA